MQPDHVARIPDPRPLAARKVAGEALSPTNMYGWTLLCALVAYAILGKGFAYVGFAPLYISEILLALGVLTLFWTRALLATLTVLPAALLAGLFVLVLSRIESDISQYGMDAARDSVIVVYCLFAFIVAGLLLERPSRVSKVVSYMRWFTGIYVFIGPVAYLTGQIGFMQVLPKLPNSPVPIIFLRPGELAVHLCACAVMAIVRLRSAAVVWTIMLCLGVAVVASQNRGGFLAILIPVAIALFLTGRWRGMITSLTAICFALALAYAVDVAIPTTRDDGRSIGARQIVDNLLSLLVPSQNKELDDTKIWREAWWKYIENYTLYGAYFWTGKGFGLSLAETDGFVGSERPPLRSPHNSHLTILARLGVPGVALWSSFAFSWMWLVLACARQAWSLQDETWGNLLLFTACYWLSIVINASFDVVLEGPILSIWFWSLTGFGLAVVLIYRSGLRRNTRILHQLSSELSRQSA